MVRSFPWARVLFALTAVGIAATVAATAACVPVPWWVVAALGAGFAIALGAGIFLHGSGLFARPIRGVEPARAAGRVALTFDDGPHPVHTRAVLDLLEARGHRGTFFVIGARAEAQAELLAEIARRGHGLGNHSWSHAHSTPFQAAPVLAADLERAQALFQKSAGRRPRWFRPPVGILSPRVVQAARLAKLELVGWTASARDGVASATVESATRRLERALAPGAILVLHDAAERGDRAPIAPAVLARVLDALDARGWKSVTLDDLLGDGT